MCGISSRAAAPATTLGARQHRIIENRTRSHKTLNRHTGKEIQEKLITLKILQLKRISREKSAFTLELKRRRDGERERERNGAKNERKPFYITCSVPFGFFTSPVFSFFCAVGLLRTLQSLCEDAL